MPPTQQSLYNPDMTKSKVDYNSGKCLGYCCTYPWIVVTDKDIARLANHFGISEDAARLRYTRQYEFESDDPDEYVNERILKHRKDHIYKTSCMFLDPEARRCTIYEGRPSVCREFPNGKKCGYYGFLKFERKHQDDKEFIPSA